MGFPKAFLKIKGESLGEKISRIYREAGLEDIKIVLNYRFISKAFEYELSQMESYGKIVPNLHPDRGRSYSIQLGMSKLTAAKGCFIHNIDNPGLSIGLIETMVGALQPDSYIVPVIDGHSGHPVLISNSITNYILDAPYSNWNLRDLLKGYNRIHITAKEKDLCQNLNHWEDWITYVHATNDQHNVLSEFTSVGRNDSN